MKRLNKILALVLAIVMMVGVVSVCASAADTKDAAYKVAFMDSNTASPTAISSAKAGDVVDIYISIKTNSYSPLFAFLAFYDATALTHTRQNATEVKNVNDANCSALIGRFANKLAVENPSQDLIDHEDDEIGVGEILDWGASLPTTTPHTDDMYPASFTDAQKAQFKGVNFGYLAPTNQTVLTVNTAGEYVEMVRIRFIAQKDVTLDKNVFYLLEDPVSTYIAVDPADEPFSRLQSDAPVKVSNLVVEYATAGGSTEPEQPTTITVEHAGNATDSTKVRWATADEDTRKNVLYVGFEGKISGLTDVSTLSEVGFKFSTSDADLADANKVTSVKTFVIYDFLSTDNTYKFRSIVRRPLTETDVDDKTENDTDSLNIYAQAYVVLAGSTTPITATDIISTSLKAEYDYATGKGMQKLEDRLA